MPSTTWSARTPYSEQPAAFSPAEVAGLSACRRLWLVVTHGATPLFEDKTPYAVLKYDLYRQLMSQIRDRYRHVDWQSFTGVAVGLFTPAKQ